jgi:hypothetical protein
MLDTAPRTGSRARTSLDPRSPIRKAAAGLALVISLLYFLIGSRAVTVIDDTADQTAFGLIAGGAFLLGAVVILAFDRRFLWILGSLAQVFIILVYFDLADERVPPYEFWGISIRVLQVLLLGALLYLAGTSGRVDAGRGEKGG